MKRLNAKTVRDKLFPTLGFNTMKNWIPDEYIGLEKQRKNALFFAFLESIAEKFLCCTINGVKWCYDAEGYSMAYFLKKSNLKKGLYLQIYESFYNPDKKETSHRSYKSLGYTNNLIDTGINDPIMHFSAIVKKMNEDAKLAKQEERDRQISESPEKHLGYFLIKAIYEGLGVSRFLDFLQSTRNFRFNISKLMEALIYSRMIEPCSKSKTSKEVIPSLYGKYDFSYDQVLDGVEFIGNEYEKIIEIFNHQLNLKYPPDTTTTYFDGTNFYFDTNLK